MNHFVSWKFNIKIFLYLDRCFIILYRIEETKWICTKTHIFSESQTIIKFPISCILIILTNREVHIKIHRQNKTKIQLSNSCNRCRRWFDPTAKTSQNIFWLFSQSTQVDDEISKFFLLAKKKTHPWKNRKSLLRKLGGARWNFISTPKSHFSQTLLPPHFLALCPKLTGSQEAGKKVLLSKQGHEGVSFVASTSISLP